MDNQVFESTAERTFQYQSSLPPLPVPDLQNTLNKYLHSVKPFASEEEFGATEAIVKRFEKGIGQQLHQKLLQRAKSRRNWLEDWWLDTAYLEVRIPSQLNVNFGGPTAYLEHCWPPREGTQLERSSINLWHSLQYWDLIRTERLAVHKAGTTPFDMDQFRMLFCTCKVPGITKDNILNFFKTESEGPCPSHMIVMCRGRVFTFDALCDGRILTPPELLRQLTYIKECCDGEPEGDGVSALTTEERTRWAKAREYLISIDPVNKNILETIQSSLFVLALDDAKPYATPENYTQLTHLALTGDPTIRWGDKSYNLICFSNGTFASNCDHAPYDAMVLVSNGYYVDQKLKACGGVWKGSEVVREMPVPEELIFTVDERVRRDIALAKEQYNKSSQDLQVVSYAFTSFGKAAIKKKKLHPDTFVQLALQLAYYRLHGKSGSCYETATTRRFFHGRTETMRPCTVEAQHWCRTMLNPTATIEEKRQALNAAFSKHNKLMGEAQDGRGFDRHLLGLYLIAKEEGLPVPELYTDPLYSKSGGGGNFVLSTSLVGYTTVLGAVAPMVPHGYGFFYRIRDDRIVASCTAWKSSPETDAETLFQNLCTSFHDIMHVTTLSQL
ncbi:peroxisomal carnitine O-octanoyltransferase [Ctenopharyngodon idella]|uniref:peroxisomal carnitine O-octanoyltransferase n=1 Tax=Ctenopharyngodon idella TaxID=7959 RepID=UPI00222F9316|nr:peroxisomal carnitine O-octanoyltransferase [Ctenopharyngodon idella]